MSQHNRDILYYKPFSVEQRSVGHPVTLNSSVPCLGFVKCILGEAVNNFHRFALQEGFHRIKQT